MTTATTTSHGHGHGHHGQHAMPAMTPSGDVATGIVFPEAGRVEMRTLSLRESAHDEAVVATKFSSISAGTERLLFSGKLPGFPQLQFPLVPGYEAAGVIERIGPNDAGLKVGDEVFVGGSMCYTDAFAAFGGQSSHLIKKIDALIPLRGIPLSSAPLLALAATSLHGVSRLGDVAGKRVGVVGMGAIGQFAARFLAAAGAHVYGADTAKERLDIDIDMERIDLADQTLDAAVQGLDATIEASGHPEMLAACARAMRSGGEVCILSYYDTMSTPFPDLFVKEVSLHIAREWAPGDLALARDAIAGGRVGVGRLAEHVVPIESYDAAYTTAFEDRSVAKVILKWA
jgi:3-hydroxyethyl bacteriochlorophyllide a dehydrogenase